MSVFNGQEVAVAYRATLVAIQHKIDTIPFRRLKDLRPDEIDDFASTYYLDKVEADFDNPILRDVIDGQEWVSNPFHGYRQSADLRIKGREFIFDVRVRKGVEYVRYSPRGGAEQFDYVILVDRNFEQMELVKGEDGCDYISFSLFVPEQVLEKLSPDKIPDYLDQQKKEYLKGTIQRLNHLNAIIDARNKDLLTETKKMISDKIAHDSLTEKIAGAVGVQLIPRNGEMKQGERIEIIPKRLNSPLASEEAYDGYYIDSSNYKAIIETIRQHLIATENLPKAINKLDNEELIRDTILWTLRATYFIANGETFRQSGKTDISIEYRDKSAFVAECKIWRGPSTVQQAINQLLGYTTWRDSKACIIIFNLDTQSFDKVCAEVLIEAKKHPRYRADIRINAKNDFALTYEDPMDEKSCIEMSFLIANYVRRE